MESISPRNTIFVAHRSEKSQVLVGSEPRKYGASKLVEKNARLRLTIVYRPRQENKAADALSRIIVEDCHALSVHKCMDFDEVASVIEAYPEMQKIKQAILTESSAPEGYEVYEGKLLYRGRS